MTDTILQIAKDKAYNRSIGAQLRSISQTKLHEWKKPRNIAKVATTSATTFAPPVVGTFIEWAEGKLLDKLRTHYHSRRLSLTDDDYTRMKLSIKTLDVEHLDISRRKTYRCVEALRQATSECHSQKQPCKKAYKLAYRYYRLENRLAKLSAEAQTLIEIGQEILQWAGRIEQQLNEKALKQQVESMLGFDHRSCGGACFFAERARLVGPPGSFDPLQSFERELVPLEEDW